MTQHFLLSSGVRPDLDWLLQFCGQQSIGAWNLVEELRRRGFAIVPVVPTLAMLEASYRHTYEKPRNGGAQLKERMATALAGDRRSEHFVKMAGRYSAMVAAAPKENSPQEVNPEG